MNKAIREDLKASAGRQGSTVLLADTNEQRLTALEQALVDSRFSVDVVPSGDGVYALDALRQRQYTVAVLDSGLRRYSGFQVCSAVRETPGTDATVMVLLCKEGDAAEAFWAAEVGANLTVSDNKKPKVLVSKLRRLLR